MEKDKQEQWEVKTYHFIVESFKFIIFLISWLGFVFIIIPIIVRGGLL